MKYISIVILLILFTGLSCKKIDKPSQVLPQNAQQIQDSGESVQTTQLQQKLGTLNFQLPRSMSNAPEINLKGLDGKSYTLADFKGKTVLLNFWATWCPPCKEEMPTIQNFYKRYKDSNIVILAVSIGEDEATVREFIAENKYTFPVLIDPEQTSVGKYGIEAIPTTYVINPQGQMEARIVSSFHWDTAEFFEAFDLLK